MGHAADGVRLFSIPTQPVSTAIVRLADEAHVSIGGIDPQACGRSNAVYGTLTVDRALEILLGTSNCQSRRIDATTYLLALRPQPLHALSVPVETSDPTEVIISAGRQQQMAGNTPSAISVVSSDFLRRSDRGLAALSSEVPGLTLTNLGSGRDKILMRGISDGIFTGHTQSTVGLYLDNTPITFNAPDPDLLLVDMTRIEVLRGPQGALYGEGSISGVVRLVTNKPDLKIFSESLGAAVGVSATGAPSSEIEAVTNFPIIPKTLALRAVIYTDEAGGYIDDVGLAKSNDNSVQRIGSRLSLMWQLSDTWSLQGAYTAQEINAKNSQYVSGNLGTYIRDVPVREPHDNDFKNGSFDLVGRTNVGTVRASVNHLHHQIQSRYDASLLATYFNLPQQERLAYDDSHRVELTTADFSLTSSSEGRLRWMGGIFSSQSSESELPTLSDLTANTTLYDEHRHEIVDTMAVYGETSYDVTDQLTLTAGLRSTQSRHSVDSTMTTSAGFTKSISDGSETNHLSHQLVLRYRPNERVMFYAQSAEGYRDPGFNTTRLSTSAAVPLKYAGDELNSYEAGLKLNFVPDRLRMNIALFRVLWRDIQSDQLQSTGLPMTVNIGNGENSGLELEADWAPMSNLSMHTAGLFNEPRLTRPNPQFATAEDSGLPFIARLSYSVSADWKQTLGAGHVDSAATLSYRSLSHLNFGALQTIEMGGYTTLNLSSRLQLGRIRYGARVDNATNIKGNSFAYGNPFSLGTMAQTTPLRPRTVWFSVDVDY